MKYAIVHLKHGVPKSVDICTGFEEAWAKRNEAIKQIADYTAMMTVFQPLFVDWQDTEDNFQKFAADFNRHSREERVYIYPVEDE